MSQTPGSFRPGELADADAAPSDAELATAWSMARELEAALPPDTIGPSANFTAAVMAAVALEPAPRRAGFLAAFRAHPGVPGLIATVRDAWTVASRGPGRPAGSRGLALAYVLAVVLVGTSLTGIAAYGAAGALGFLEGDRGPTPSVVAPSATPTVSPEPTRTPDASMSPVPDGSAEPTGSTEPEPSDDGSPSPAASSSAGPSASPTASDDHDDSSPSPSHDDNSSPEPSRTPRPSDTPKPSESPD